MGGGPAAVEELDGGELTSGLIPGLKEEEKQCYDCHHYERNISIYFFYLFIPR